MRHLPRGIFLTTYLNSEFARNPLREKIWGTTDRNHQEQTTHSDAPNYSSLLKILVMN